MTAHVLVAPPLIGILSMAVLFLMLVVFLLAALRRAAQARRAAESALRHSEDLAGRHEQAIRDLRAERDRERSRADDAEQSGAALTAEHRGREERIGRLTAELEAARGALGDLREQRTRDQSEAAQLSARAADLERSRQSLCEERAALESSNGQLRDTLQAREQELTAVREQQRAVEITAAEIEAARKQLTLMQEAQQRLLDEKFQALSHAVVAQGRAELIHAAEQQFGSFSKPVSEQLRLLDQNLRELEGRRATAETRLSEQVAQLNSLSEGVRRETQSLADALRKPQARGAWGEQHLQRTVELAGLVEHCDFQTQTTVVDEDGTFRPDLVVHLAGGKQVVVDAKVPLMAFLDAEEAPDEDSRAACFARHARHVRQHVDALSGKEYHRRLPCTPEFVVLYLPGEGCLERALAHDPQLMEYAGARRVLLATPTILLGMLRAIAFAWTQAALAENMREVSALGRQLYERISALGKHLDRLGRALESSVKAYNDTVGSTERRLLVTARKFQSLKVVEAELPPLAPIANAVRPLTVSELTPANSEECAAKQSPGDGVPSKLWLPRRSEPRRSSGTGAA